MCSCSTAVRWGGGDGSFKHSTAGLSGPTQPWACDHPTQWALLNYVMFTAKHLEGIGLLAVLLLDFIKTSDMKWQHIKQSISFETATSVLKHQGQCLARNKAPCIEAGPACAYVPQVWHFPTLRKVPPTANRTGTAPELDLEKCF